MERMNLLVCDLDGTLLGDDCALDEFAAWYARVKDHFRLAYSSGRFIDSIRESIAATNLPPPDAIVGGVGTEIYDLAASRRASMWPPSTLGWNPYVVRTICESHDELEPQPDYLHSYHKISFFGHDLDESFIDDLIRQMTAVGQQVTVVYSSNRDLDVLPAGVNKGAAVIFLADRWKIDPQRVLVAGDSGNDAAMFHVGFRGIVVGNALPELRTIVAPHVYQAAAEFAAGVLEGLDYWLQASSVAPTIAAQLYVVQDAGRGTRG